MPKVLPGQLELVPPEPEKECGSCRETLPHSAFALNRTEADGRQGFCRACRKKLYAQRNYSLGKTCEDCGKPIVNHSLGKCIRCRGIAKRGTPEMLRNGGRAMTVGGYVLLSQQWDHPNCDKRGLLLEHVKVMSEILGRPLVKGENVHHINGVRDDNRPENLEVWSHSQPCGQRIPDKVAWAIEILALYEPSALAASERDAA